MSSVRSGASHFALTIAVVVAACADQPSTLTSGAGGGIPAGNATAASTGTSGPATDPKGLFTANVEQGLRDNCRSCHEPGGISDMPFLNPTSYYQSISSWPRMIRKDPTTSILLTRPMTGSGHVGTNLDAPGLETFHQAIKDWLAAEAAALVDVEDEKPHTEPITPVLGHNVVYFDQMSAALAGLSITFEADQVTDNTLELSGLEVYTTKATGVHIVHPVFVVHPKNEEASPDPIDNFSGMDARFPESSHSALGSGIVVLTNWKPEAKISIVFDSIEPWTEGGGTGGGGGSVGGGCKALGDFSSIKGQFGPCQACHLAGGIGNASVNMDGLDSGDDADACSQIRLRIDTADPNNSQIFRVTDPNGGTSHDFQFGGNVGNWQAFRTAVSTWVTAEQ